MQAPAYGKCLQLAVLWCIAGTRPDRSADSGETLTTWSKLQLEKLIFAQLVKKLAPFYVARKFMIGFTTVCHCHLSPARLIPVNARPIYSY